MFFIISGSDQEKAIVLGLEKSFKEAVIVFCTLHLKKNLKRYMLKKLKTSKKEFNGVYRRIFGRNGIIHCKHGEEFDTFKENLLEKYGRLFEGSEGSNYLQDFLDRIERNVMYPHWVTDRISVEFTNNDSETFNSVVKGITKGDTLALPDLVNMFASVFNMQRNYVMQALQGFGKYLLQDWMLPSFSVKSKDWQAMTREQRLKKYEKFSNGLQKRPSSKAKVVSKNKLIEMQNFRKRGAKPGTSAKKSKTVNKKSNPEGVPLREFKRLKEQEIDSDDEYETEDSDFECKDKAKPKEKAKAKETVKPKETLKAKEKAKEKAKPKIKPPPKAAAKSKSTGKSTLKKEESDSDFEDSKDDNKSKTKPEKEDKKKKKKKAKAWKISSSSSDDDSESTNESFGIFSQKKRKDALTPIKPLDPEKGHKRKKRDTGFSRKLSFGTNEGNSESDESDFSKKLFGKSSSPEPNLPPAPCSQESPHEKSVSPEPAMPSPPQVQKSSAEEMLEEKKEDKQSDDHDSDSIHLGDSDGETEEELKRRAAEKFEVWKKNMPPKEELDRRISERLKSMRTLEQADERLKRRRSKQQKTRVLPKRLKKTPPNLKSPFVTDDKKKKNKK